VGVADGSRPGLDERRLYGSPTRPAGVGQRVQRIGWLDPTRSGRTQSHIGRPKAVNQGFSPLFRAVAVCQRLSLPVHRSEPTVFKDLRCTDLAVNGEILVLELAGNTTEKAGMPTWAHPPSEFGLTDCSIAALPIRQSWADVGPALVLNGFAAKVSVWVYLRRMSAAWRSMCGTQYAYAQTASQWAATLAPYRQLVPQRHYRVPGQMCPVHRTHNGPSNEIGAKGQPSFWLDGRSKQSA
jgi:hypothetical protein